MTGNAWRATEGPASGPKQIADDEDVTLYPPYNTKTFSTSAPHTLGVVRDQSAIKPRTKLEQEWNTLAAQSSASPYLRPGWVAAWWRAFGGGDLEIRTLWEHGKLTAVLPMARQRRAFKSTANGHSPRFGLLAKDVESATDLVRTLFSERPWRVSVIALDLAGNSMKACCRAAEEAGYRIMLRPYQRSPYLEIRDTWADYQSRLSKTMLRNIGRCRRRLARKGTISFDISDDRDDALDKHLSEAFSIEASGWKGKKRTAILSNPETVQFYTEIAHWAVKKKMLRIFFLRMNGRPLAMYYALVDSGTCYLLKGGYESDYAAFSPGTILMHEVVSYCFSKGLSNIEFHGDAHRYKFNWANAVHSQNRFEAYSPSITGFITWSALAYGRPAVKSMAQSLHILKREDDL